MRLLQNTKINKQVEYEEECAMISATNLKTNIW